MTTQTPDRDVIVIGAGVAGIYAIYRLRESGFDVHAFESGSGVGGTWFWNRYPGCRCDVDSLEYSYSFSDELQQEWHWHERYGTQTQILEYLNHVTERFDLNKHITLNTRIDTAVCETHTARYCIMATGNLSTPNTPDIAGLEDFEGPWYHTGMWPHEGVDFTGQRVAVIGTGSSGVQMIPHVAQQADRLHVFQRTANFSVPAKNRIMDSEVEREHKSTYVQRRRDAFKTPFGIAGYPPPDKEALEDSPESHVETFESKWQRGGNISFLYAYKDLLTNAESNDVASEFVRNKIRSIVNDPATAETLCPTTHPIGTKRLIIDTDYFETYNQEHVTLVDISSDGIETFTPKGLRANGTEYEFDAVAFATGFDAMTGAMRRIDIRTSSGKVLEDKWTHGPTTYLGIMVADFPNMFMITGPQSPGVKSNMMFSIEQHTNWIADCIEHMRDSDKTRIEAEQQAEDAWVDHNNEVANATLYPRANSWYMGVNIPGKPAIFMPYVGGCEAYNEKCKSVVANDYEGFELS